MNRPPDIVLLHAHDLGKWLSCYGVPGLGDPNLRQLADRSVVFDRAFATAPLCSPARGSLFTGLSPHRHGLNGLVHKGWRYRSGVATLPELLRPLGYRSALVGLEHENVDPTVLGFDDVAGLGFLPRALPVAHEATSYLRHLGEERDEPAFVTIGMWEVHRPWPVEDYRPADPATVHVPPYLPDNEHTREDIAAFYGAVRQLDSAAGIVLDAVDRYLDPARTLLIVTTDHGAAFPWAKGTLYDPGTNVALLVRPPTSWEVPPGRHGGLVSHLDIAPTVVELAGGPPPADLEGRSLLPALRSGYRDVDRALFAEKTYHDFYDPVRSVRTESVKYVRNFGAGPRLSLSKDIEESPTRRGLGDDHLAPRPAEELYDLDADPDERNNVAADPAYGAVLAEHAARLHAWMKQTGDPLLDPLLDGEMSPPPARSRDVDALPPLPPG